MTVHLIYPHKNRISAPHVIGYKLSEELRKYFEVVTHEWDSIKTITPKKGDILIGHPHPLPFTIFKNSSKVAGWKRKIIMQPYNSDFAQIGHIDDVIDRCDLFLAITGDFWFTNIKDGATLRWLPKMVQLNLAVDRAQFPKVKTGFNPAGRRKFLYIGNDHPGKNLAYLSSIATTLNEYEFAWAGKGSTYPGLKRLGYVDFSAESGCQIAASYDFMITVGKADANPTTILEALSWGLIPICTETSGYYNEYGILNIPSDDLTSACSILSNLQFADASYLTGLSEAGSLLLESKYNWPKFFSVVVASINSAASPLITPKAAHNRFRLNGPTVKSAAKLIFNNLVRACRK